MLDSNSIPVALGWMPSERNVCTDDVSKSDRMPLILLRFDFSFSSSEDYTNA